MPHNPAAFARPFSDRPIGKDETTFHEAQEGMTLRDYFAAKAMQVYLTIESGNDDKVAHWAYATADAMLAEREKEQPYV